MLAIASLLVAPVLAAPAHASGVAAAAGCGMDMPDAASVSHKPAKGAACAAACAACAQLAPAQPGPAAAAPTRVGVGVGYARVELRLSGVEPERGTPPPR